MFKTAMLFGHILAKFAVCHETVGVRITKALSTGVILLPLKSAVKCPLNSVEAKCFLKSLKSGGGCYS